jgi:PhoPQ-activated pathogenicity-related protein
MNKTHERFTRVNERRHRRLELELLEERRVLSAAAPWLNDALPLDVNNDSQISPIDALAVINRLLLTGISPLGTPTGTPDKYYDTNGDGMLTPLDAVRVINALSRPTNVVLDTLMPYTIDLTPRLEVSVASGTSVPDGAAVHLDVDLNNDGLFTGSELDYTVSSMYRGRSEFALGPALPPDQGLNTYSINLRARVQNLSGVLFSSVVQPLVVDTQTSDALANYVNTPDPSYHWSLEYQSSGPNDAYQYYVLSMTSQTWRQGDVNDPVWDHWMQIVVPSGVTLSNTALLYISGGSNTSSIPTTPDAGMVSTSLTAHVITAELRIVPNESVYFFAENPINYRSEDDIIAYTYDQYMRHIAEPGNETWPLLLPMVKSAVRAMDTVQAFIPQITLGANQVDDFIVTGYSKRGWTTWLTTAVDDRIIASIPGVFDNPNQGPQMVHQYEVLGKFSEQVEPYSNMQVFERLKTREGELLSRIVDPYRYLNNGRFEKPKLILNSAGDEFFMPDSSQFYFADLPGQNNYLRYIPNTGHGLDERAIQSTITFTDAVLNGRQLPKFSWTVEPNGEIDVHSVDTPVRVLLWQATNPVARDFRHGYNPSILWSSSVLSDQGGGNFVGSVPYPASGATAFLVELTFQSGVAGIPYVFTTDVRVNSDLPRTPFPYSSDASAFLTGEPLALTSSAVLPPDNESESAVPLFALPTQSTVTTDAPMASPAGVTSTAPAANSAPSNAVNTANWEDAEHPPSDPRKAATSTVDLALDEWPDEPLS